MTKERQNISREEIAAGGCSEHGLILTPDCAECVDCYLELCKSSDENPGTPEPGFDLDDSEILNDPIL
jgi:hypothetical protein